MTCSTILEQMLEADLSELTSADDNPIAAHLRECTRCRAAADRLVQDTRLLAQVVGTASLARNVVPFRPRKSESRKSWAIGLVGVAAAITGLVVRGWQAVNRGYDAKTVVMQPVSALARNPKPAAESPSSSSAVVTPLPVGTRASAAHRPRRPPHRELASAVVSTAVKVERTPARPMERAVPVAPVRLDVEPRPVLGSGVLAEPAAGKRASIIPTGRADVTVVWLY